MTTSGDNPDPTSDVIFRKLLGTEENTDLLISVVNSFVDAEHQVTDLVIKNPFNLAAYKGSKESIVDIKAQAKDGTWFGVEMQLHGHTFYGKRALFYTAKGYVDQLEAGQHYSALNTTIGIHFLAFDLFNDNRMTRQFVFKDMETNERPEELKYLQLYFIEMGKLADGWANIVTPRDCWIAFLTRGKELHPNSIPPALLAEPAIVKAITTLERMGADPELREIYEAEEKARMVDIAELEYAEQKGLQRGQQHMVLQLLARRFGDPPLRITARIDAMTSAQLDEFGVALFDLHSYADVVSWLAGQ